MANVSLLSTATAVPPYTLSQEEIARAACEVFAPQMPDFAPLAAVFHTAGITKRHVTRPLQWFLEPRGWAERNAAYLDMACDLFVEAAATALARAGITPQDVGTVVTVSSTGIATPTLEARVAGRLGLRPDIERVPLFGLGCAGGTSGLSVAARLAGSRPGEIVLMVTVELCSLAFRLDKLTKENIVATALFGDGAAACVLAADRDGLAVIEASGQHTWPDTLDIMGWKVETEGLGVIFDRSIPPFAEENAAAAIGAVLARGGLALADIDRFICHPGGAKVVTALEASLGLAPGSLDAERDVLADYGNMSAPTVFFVLERILARGLPSRAALTSMGPGFSASCVALRAA
ncbi:(2-(2,4-dihydroxy-6-methylphenyl)-2-oxoethyl)-4-hydroxy-2-pyrone synthase [Chelatococcus sambhunathii]|uniref:(2-(2,4-dihydroxy-6-methylphenyl)-2-oxoethyl)-4-hydroxy-2-pyrone synthase n=1 Tax=Chelatococcus sambhunathii TaxID=363953 RepID=A0ABP2A0L1_9HYPH|nr:3-oxoacyl-[acyl-carrier-protein] synthase III C-terminal domain-containing protein [Chelatococcus sambhunathii]CUA86074.1 (2-(2,4-dihydroxy-6-methylphenyl)-2-oxoethyl)-4-hydroxy-2-pyrone synthase [Chelatococcus sambhunathii]